MPEIETCLTSPRPVTTGQPLVHFLGALVFPNHSLSGTVFKQTASTTSTLHSMQASTMLGRNQSTMNVPCRMQNTQRDINMRWFALFACTQVYPPPFHRFFELGLSPSFLMLVYIRSKPKNGKQLVLFSFLLFECIMCDGKKQKQHPMHLIYAKPSHTHTQDREQKSKRPICFDLVLFCFVTHSRHVFIVVFLGKRAEELNRLATV